MSDLEANEEARRRWGSGGYARPSLGKFCVGDTAQRGVAYGNSYEQAFAWASGYRPPWWFSGSRAAKLIAGPEFDGETWSKATREGN